MYYYPFITASSVSSMRFNHLDGYIYGRMDKGCLDGCINGREDSCIYKIVAQMVASTAASMIDQMAALTVDQCLF